MVVQQHAEVARVGIGDDEALVEPGGEHPADQLVEMERVRPGELDDAVHGHADRNSGQRLRWPTAELVDDRSQGAQLHLRELARYWATEYDWRKAEARLNAVQLVAAAPGRTGRWWDGRTTRSTKAAT